MDSTKSALGKVKHLVFNNLSADLVRLMQKGIRQKSLQDGLGDGRCALMQLQQTILTGCKPRSVETARPANNVAPAVRWPGNAVPLLQHAGHHIISTIFFKYYEKSKNKESIRDWSIQRVCSTSSGEPHKTQDLQSSHHCPSL